METTKTNCSERDSLRLSAYVDGELGDAEREALERRITSDPALQEELEWLRLSRSACERWVESLQQRTTADLPQRTTADLPQRTTADLPQRTTAEGQLWARLEPELRKEKARRERSLVGRFLAEPFGLVPRFAVGFGAFLLAVGLARSPGAGGGNGVQISADQQPLQVASRTEMQLPKWRALPVEESPLRDEPRELPFFEPRVRSVDYESDLRTVSTRMRERIPGLLASSRAPSSVDRRQLLAGGFRTDQADIEWIKSDFPFRLLHGKSRVSGPIIWVSR